LDTICGASQGHVIRQNVFLFNSKEMPFILIEQKGKSCF
jgi:hypothetical protein